LLCRNFAAVRQPTLERVTDLLTLRKKHKQLLTTGGHNVIFQEPN
jgi:hypothetical protein